MASLSEETTCFTATLYIDGKKAAVVGNRGNGGPTDYNFEDRELMKRFEAYCKSLPPDKSPHGDLPMDAEFFIDLLLEKYERAKLCKKRTVFRLKDQPGALLSLNRPFSPDMKQYLQKEYGDNLEEIVNETLAV